MPYRALLTFDFGGGHNPNEFQHMENALLALGWQHAETSAFVFDQNQGDHLPPQVWQGVVTVARAASSVGGTLSALSFVIQFIDPNLAGKTQIGSHLPLKALQDYQQLPVPGDPQAIAGT